ncbi:MAG: hypothetical protein IKU81_03200 [Oscillibacter sp.]|nr:hypothetical protein [Oscillibacter sp.]
MPETQKKYHFLFSPYIFSLTVFLMAAALIASVWMIVAAPVAGDRTPFVVLVLGIDLLLFGALLSSRETLGWYTITEDSISLHAPFRRTLTLRYEDVRHVGIGRSYALERTVKNGRYSSISASSFWLYLSCDPVPAALLTDMDRFRQTDCGLRIAYSKKAFAALMDCLPEDQKRQLERSKTTLRAWGIKDI